MPLSLESSRLRPRTTEPQTPLGGGFRGFEAGEDTYVNNTQGLDPSKTPGSNLGGGPRVDGPNYNVNHPNLREPGGTDYIIPPGGTNPPLVVPQPGGTDYIIPPNNGRPPAQPRPLYQEPTTGTGTNPITPPAANSNYPTVGMQGPYTATSSGVNPANTNSSYSATLSPQELMSYQLNQLLNSNSPYMQNARRRGNEQAASRGMLNSSISAGTSQRAAIEAGAPIAAYDAGAHTNVNDQNRGFAFGEAAANNQMGRQDFLNASQSARDFQYSDALSNNNTIRQNWLGQESDSRSARFSDALAENAAIRTDWLNSNQFERQFNQTLALMPMSSAFDFWNNAMSMALEDPSVYTPEIINGLSNFNITNLQAIIQAYLGGTTPGGT